MSGNSINFDDEEIKISNSCKIKNKKIFNIDGINVDKLLVSKKYHMVKIIHLNTLLDITITIL